jgi:hypothetical protein
MVTQARLAGRAVAQYVGLVRSLFEAAIDRAPGKDMARRRDTTPWSLLRASVLRSKPHEDSLHLDHLDRYLGVNRHLFVRGRLTSAFKALRY